MKLRDILPIGAAVLLAAFVVVFSQAASVTVVSNKAATSSSEAASPTLATTTSPITAATSYPILSKATTTPAAAASADSQNVDLTHAGAQLLKSLVNILCIPDKASPLRGVSGSGVIIDSRGLILTAAHVGQYFLMRDYPKPDSVTCVIRTGGPATATYTADVVYVSPSWIANNPETLSETEPTGTGENDFAILAITGSANGAPLPSVFPSVPLSSTNGALGEKVAIGAYAAQFLGSEEIEDDLYPTIVFNTITDRYTFNTDTVDLISINGTPAAQEGSSGGGVANAESQLIGLITTSQINGDAASRVLHAITPLHIRASFYADSGANLDDYLASNDLETLVSNFSSEAATLRKVLVNALP